MKSLLLMLSGLVFILSGCMEYDVAQPNSTLTSKFEVSDPALKPGIPDWSAGKVIVKDKDGVVVKSVDFKNSGSGSKATTLELKYNDYMFALEYKDSTGKVIYESCKNEVSKLHEVKEAKVILKPRLCLAGTETQASDDATVILEPTFETSEEGSDPSSVDGTWDLCTNGATFSILSTYTIDTSNNQIQWSAELYEDVSCPNQNGKGSAVSSFTATIIDMSAEPISNITFKVSGSTVMNSITVAYRDGKLEKSESCANAQISGASSCESAIEIYEKR